MTFDLQYTDPKSNARAGIITTDHGQIETVADRERYIEEDCTG